tara:strand:+ start:4725 stop:5708 length:984 start_codon:yes stop_codon:yes gene_type:complete
MNNFKEIWHSQAINSNGISVREKITLSNGIGCYVGYINISNSKIFQIETNQENLFSKAYLKRFRGVEIRVLDSGSDKKDITIILSDNDLLDIFILFIEDLIKELGIISNEKEISRIINKKVSYWGRIFARINGELLSKERQRGLYGELTFLRSLLNHSPNQANCIKTWTGPEGSNQDFSNQVSATEIKTSKATSPSVNIANELQLDWSVFESLFLVVLHVDEINNGPNTLNRLIRDIKLRISFQTELLQLFEGKLERIGISIEEEELYDDIGYVIRSQKGYKVADGFPSLTNEIINNVAIHNVQYQIDLTACEPFEIAFEHVMNSML